MKLRFILWPLFFIGLWQFIFFLQIFPVLVFPSVTDIVIQLSVDLRSGELLKGTLFSIFVIIIAMVPSMVLGFLMAFLSVKFKRVERLTEMISALAHPLPGIALLPLLILWSGLGIHIIVLIVIHSVLWPFYISIRSGFKEVPALWIDLGRNNGLNRREEFLYILLPAAFPSVIAGLKISWARAWRAVISAEMIFGTIGSAGGLGWFIYNKRIFMDTPGMYGGVLFLMVIGLLVEKLLFTNLEKRTAIRWGDSHGFN